MRSTYLPAFEELVADREYDSSQANALPGGDGDGQPDFPGGRRYFRLTYLAKKFWDWVRFLFKVLVKLYKRFQNVHFFSESGKNDRLGRPTTPDNFLLGGRNAWVSLLEESWPEIGWPLHSIRERRRSTIEDVGRVFEPLKERPNGGLAAAFYRQSSEPANPAEVRKNRIRHSKLDVELFQTQTKRDEQERLCREAEAASQNANPNDRETMQAAASRRKECLLQLEGNLKRMENERDALYKKLLDQETYVRRSELLDFLRSGRYQINPRNLANALAGLPIMVWRQSFSRCSKMPFESDPHLWYQVFEVILSISKRYPEDSDEAPVEFFRTAILKLPKKTGYVREYLGQYWRFLRLAIEECWISKPLIAAIPFVVTSKFLQKLGGINNPVERVLASEERLIFS